MSVSVDVAVVGGGVVGCAIARELAGTALSVAILEARSDVGDGTSKANTAILHTGFDAKPGTLESRLVARGHALLGDYAERTGIPVERTGAVLVAWTEDELEALPGLRDTAERNGYHRCALIDASAVYALVPDLGAGVTGGLTVPDEAIICTWTTTLALAADAVRRGARLLRDCRVLAVEVDDSHPAPGTLLQTSQGPVRARWVVNAAGLGADQVDRLFGFDRFTVTPRRGELLVFDKLARPKVPLIVLPVPTARGKGVLLSPTVYGNVLLGPTSETLQDRGATGTSEAGFDALLTTGGRLMPSLVEEEVTAAYAGLRAAIGSADDLSADDLSADDLSDDYLIHCDPERKYVVTGGIRSTGLTAGLAIAEHVAALLSDAGVDVAPRADLPAPVRMPNLGEAGVRPFEDADLISGDAEYGRIVCFCERVTAGEIRDAFRSAVPPVDLDGLRRRTRVMNGRCQGFSCGARAAVLLEGGMAR